MTNSITQDKISETTKDFIKNHIKTIFIALITSITSVSAISYVTSKLFIKSYLTEIGFKQLTYDAFTENNISLITLGICITIFSFLYSFILAPSTLRYLFKDISNLYTEQVEKHKLKINIFFTLCLLSTLLILIPWEHSGYFVFSGFLSCLVFCVFIITNRNKIDNSIKILFNGLLFGGVATLAFLPFVIFVEAINYANLSNSISYILISVIWVIYSFLIGFRITENNSFQYFIDITIAVLIFFELMILSSNTIKIPIAEFIQIKDKSSSFYKMKREDFQKIEGDINLLWNEKSKCTDVTKENCHALTFKTDKTVYLNTQVIFRNNKDVIICPPNFTINHSNNRCFITSKSSLIPTSQTQDSLLKNPSLKQNLVKFKQ